MTNSPGRAEGMKAASDDKITGSAVLRSPVLKLDNPHAPWLPYLDSWVRRVFPCVCVAVAVCPDVADLLSSHGDGSYFLLVFL